MLNWLRRRGVTITPGILERSVSELKRETRGNDDENPDLGLDHKSRAVYVVDPKGGVSDDPLGNLEDEARIQSGQEMVSALPNGAAAGAAGGLILLWWLANAAKPACLLAAPICAVAF